MIKIPNINMPKSCFSCFCEQESTCGAMKKIIDYDQQPDKQRMDWCPLIEEQEGKPLSLREDGYYGCPRCGHLVSSGSNYCALCGQKILGC